VLAVPVAQFEQALFPFRPVNSMVLALREIASIANSILVEMDGSLLAVPGVPIFHSRIRALIRNHALLAVNDMPRQPIEGSWIYGIFGELAQINRVWVLDSFHIYLPVFLNYDFQALARLKSSGRPMSSQGSCIG